MDDPLLQLNKALASLVGTKVQFARTSAPFAALDVSGVLEMNPEDPAKMWSVETVANKYGAIFRISFATDHIESLAVLPSGLPIISLKKEEVFR